MWPVYPPAAEPGSESQTSLEASRIQPTGPGSPEPTGDQKKHRAAAVVVGVCAAVLVAAAGVGLINRASSHGSVDYSQPVPGAYVGDDHDYGGYRDQEDGYYPADPNEAAGTVMVTADGAPVTTGLIVSVVGDQASIVVPYHKVLGKTGLAAEQSSDTGRVQSSVEIVGFDVTKDLAVLRATEWSGGSQAPLAALSSSANDPTVVSRVIAGSDAMEMNGYFSGSSGSDYAEIRLGPDETFGGQGYLGMVHGLLCVTVGIDAADEGIVFNEDAQAIGLVVRAIGNSQPYGHGTDLYAVPIEEARALAAMVQAGKDSGNVRVGPAGDLGLTQVWQSATAQDQVIVTSVTPGGSAEQAGIHVGDTLVSIDGIPVRAVQGAQVGPEGVIRMLEPGSVVTVEWRAELGGPLTSAQLTVMAAP
jgi:S1-C subfamily serine protease